MLSPRWIIGFVILGLCASYGPRAASAATSGQADSKDQILRMIIAAQEREIERQIAVRIERVARQTARLDRFVPTTRSQEIQVTRRLEVLAQRNARLQQQAASPPPGPVLRAIEVRERQLTAQETRMTATIERLADLAVRNPRLETRVAALTQRLEFRVQQTGQLLQRLERIAATPFSP